MILKLLIDFYRWLWGMKPWVVQVAYDDIDMVIMFGAMIDICAIVGIVGLAVTAYENRVVVNFPFGEKYDLCIKCARELFPEQKESEARDEN